MKRHQALIQVTVLSFAVGRALGQGTPPDYGFTWRTIGDPGNAPAMPGPDFQWLIDPWGAVGYEYRMTRTEVTNTQWLEFVDTYSRFHTGFDVINDPAFSGFDIYRVSDSPQNFGWRCQIGSENAPVQMSWFYAARYCNWLHNGKVNEPWAFEGGAYTLSGYQHLPGPGPDGHWEGQATRSPGARFWIPSIDEWAKGMYFDPNRFGPGQAGYWLFPTMSNTPPIGGAPGTPGTQTSAGDWGSPLDGWIPVGSYQDVQSPWGLLDGSGGVSEYNESVYSLFARHGSYAHDWLYETWDRLDNLGYTWPAQPMGGLRIASSVPSPGTALVLGCVVFGLRGRSRHVQAPFRHTRWAWNGPRS